MPLCTIYLLSLHTTTPNPIPTFISTLQSTSTKPLIISRVIRWIILPTKLSTSSLLAQNIHWDLLLILPSTAPLPSALQPQIAHQWSITAGIPSRLLQDFPSKNKALLYPDPTSVPKLTGALNDPKIASSAQGLELSPELSSWIQAFNSSGEREGQGAVSMLNLLSFLPDKKADYLQYGAAFAESIGARRGGNAKIVGTVVEVDGVKKEEGDGGWDEIALAHYPSILHFADMLASEDYQEVNQRYRAPSLSDTCILFTSEVGIDGLLGKEVDKDKESKL
ncbi:hypothetical protein K491DRAFT_770558 [Lophiostoma macrostomum CBS 122681]|uniref:DUF1330 domain-containing protein n=1 Tax=Lophiostoma macrostomum CBS 122681 TaxID=1314788 RepID=A0A6A6SUK8_9PLEO|nr:hypothetical protein K491DRAFT_770558 [Lophiostoma macrostomum CBS 122681]